MYFTERYSAVRKVLLDTFFGPPNVGVYSPSVQSTLYQMAKAVLNGLVPYSSSVCCFFASTLNSGESCFIRLKYSFCLTQSLCFFELPKNFRFPDVSSIHLKMPNLHFLPVNLPSPQNPNVVKVGLSNKELLAAGMLSPPLFAFFTFSFLFPSLLG